MDILTQAFSWLNRGIAIIPCRQDKTPAIAWKHYQTNLPTRQQVCDWLGIWPSYGVVVGWQHLTVIDFDRHDVYFAWRADAIARGGVPEAVAKCSYTVITGRGVHVYVMSLDRVDAHFDGGDVKGPGGYVLGAGSLHPSGVRYQALDDVAPILPVGDLVDVFPMLTRPQAQREAPAPILGRTVASSWPNIGCGAAQALDPWSAAGIALSGRELLDLAKRAMSIWAVLGAELVYQSDATHWMARCPMHDDQNPSLVIDTASNRASCFAGCTGPRGWSAVDAAMWRLGTSDYMAAARWLLGR